jgi:hypothetical protein
MLVLLDQVIARLFRLGNVRSVKGKLYQVTPIYNLFLHVRSGLLWLGQVISGYVRFGQVMSG